MEPIQLLIADDHHLLLDGLVSLLNEENDITVAATATNGFQVLDLLSKQAFDICLLDINMPGMDGIETATVLQEKYPGLKIIILTTYNDKEIISEMLHLHISGYVLKNATRDELIRAIKKVVGGGLYFSEEVYDAITKNYMGNLDTEKQKQKTITLTSRETEILQLIAKEYTNEKIAAELAISYRTVETHRKNIMHKTKAHNLAGLLKFAYSNKLIH